jgi:hypothetical protein
MPLALDATLEIYHATYFFYADGIVTLSPSWHAQQKLFNLCHHEIKRLSMSLNVAKTVNVIFTPYKINRRVLPSFPNFKLCGHLVANVNKCKYLGHCGCLLMMMMIVPTL